MKKYLPYIVIAVLIILAAGFVSSKFNLKKAPISQTSERIPVDVDLGSTPVPVSEVKLDSKTAVQTSIDTELKWLDGEVSQGNKVDFSDTGLSDSELGL